MVGSILCRNHGADDSAGNLPSPQLLAALPEVKVIIHVRDETAGAVFAYSVR